MESQESGIDLGFDVTAFMENAELDLDLQINDANLGTIKSKPISPVTTEIKYAPVKNRTNLRQQLHRQRIMEEHQQNEQQQQQQQLASQSIQMPGSQQQVQVEVLPMTAQSVSRLEHPTRYHLQAKVRSELENFASLSMGGKDITVQSLPTPHNPSASLLSPQHHVSMGLGSAPSQNIEPSSPALSFGRTSATNSVCSDILEDIHDICLNQLEHADTSQDKYLLDLDAHHLSQTLPHNGSNFSTVDQTDFDMPSPVIIPGKSSTSCPEVLNPATPTRQVGGRQRQGPPSAFYNDDDKRTWEKERQKKDNHNIIERRRRYNINDRIKEIATLLPRHLDPVVTASFRDTRQCKGSILQHSVTYIKKLQNDQKKMQNLEEEKKRWMTTNRQMLLRIQELEIQMQTNGLESSPTQATSAANSSDTLTNIFGARPIHAAANVAPVVPDVKDEPMDPEGMLPTVVAVTEDIMDDGTLIGADPMMSSSSPTVYYDSANHNHVVTIDDMTENFS